MSTTPRKKLPRSWTDDAPEVFETVEDAEDLKRRIEELEAQMKKENIVKGWRFWTP